MSISTSANIEKDWILHKREKASFEKQEQEKLVQESYENNAKGAVIEPPDLVDLGLLESLTKSDKVSESCLNIATKSKTKNIKPIEYAYYSGDYVANPSKLDKLLFLLQLITNGPTVTPIDQSQLPDLLNTINQVNSGKEVNVYRSGRWHDLDKYNKLAQYLEQTGVPFSMQSPMWKNTLEEEVTIAAYLSLFDYRFERIISFLEKKSITNKEIQIEVLAIIKSLFPRVEHRLDLSFVTELAFDENYQPSKLEVEEKLKELFINSLLYGDFSKEYGDYSLYLENAIPLSKVVKISRSTGGEGVAIFSTNEIVQLRKQPKEKLFDGVIEAVFNKLSAKDKDVKLSDVKHYIITGMAVIKERLMYDNNETFGLALFKPAGEAEKLQLTPLGLTKEIKNGQNLWVGTRGHSNLTLSNLLKGTNLQGKEHLMLLAIESFEYYMGTFKFIGKYDSQGKPITTVSSVQDFSSQNYYSGVDLCVQLKPIDATYYIPAEEAENLRQQGLLDVKQQEGSLILLKKEDQKPVAVFKCVKELKILEFAGRKPGSAEIIGKAKKHDSEDFIYERDIKTMVPAAFFTGKNKRLAVQAFAKFFKARREELAGKSLNDVATINNLVSGYFLSFGLIVYDEYSSQLDLVKKVFSKFVDEKVEINGKTKLIKEIMFDNE